MQTATASEIQQAIALLGKTPQLLETLLGDLPDDLLRWKPKPDRWSISEVLAHLAALEQVYAERVRRMVAEDSPALAKYDLDGAKAREDYSHGSGTENLANFTHTHRSTLAMLAGLPASAGRPLASTPNLGPSPSPMCSTNGPITTSATCGRSKNSTARTHFIRIPARS